MTQWFERKFRFDEPVSAIKGMLAKLDGLTGDIAREIKGLSREQLAQRDGDKWSIQEQIGHLLDLDELHFNRLDDYEHAAKALRPADLKNIKTWEAHHNDREIQELLSDLKRE